MKISLYLGGEMVDLSNDISVAMSYESIDFSNPKAEKNSYSKSVELQGTNRNNRIMGNIYRFDRIITDADSVVGASYDANKRLPYTLLHNGSLFEKGYAQLDEVAVEDGNIVYSLTLYGNLGDFFNNLKANDEDDELTLANLYYGFKDIEDETNDNLIDYNKEFLQRSWNVRTNETIWNETPDNDINKIFCPIPTYSGYYDDFDSNKVLVNSFLVPSKYPVSVEEDGKTYTDRNYWTVCEMSRELTEWEINDIRSHYQRMGVRFKTIYEAIKNPRNNGGYEVDDSNLNDEIYQYIENGYVMLNRFDWSEVNENYSDTTIELTFGHSPLVTIPNSTDRYDTTDSSTFDLKNYYSPSVALYLLPEVHLTGDMSGNKVYLTNVQYTKWASDFSAYGPIEADIFGNYLAYWMDYLDGDGNVISSSAAHIVTSTNITADEMGIKTKHIVPSSYLWSLLRSKYGAEHVNDIVYEDVTLKKNVDVGGIMKDDIGKYFNTDKSIEINEKLTKDVKSIKVNSALMSVYCQMKRDKKEYGLGEWYTSAMSESNENMIYVDNKPLATTFEINSYINHIDDEYTMVYDGDVVQAEQRHILSKKAIFYNSKTPFDYLIGFGRMFNLKFEYDDITDKIFIYSKNRYYKEKVNDITDKVNHSSISLIPTTAEYKAYDFSLENEDTYATDIYKKKNKTPYAKYSMRTSYQFNSESNEVLEDTVYQNVMPWRLNSVYFTKDKQGWIKPMMGNKYTVTLWNYNEADDKWDSKQEECSGMLVYERNTPQNIMDSIPKYCCFDKDYKNVDIDNAFILYDAEATMTQNKDNEYYYVTDNIPITTQLNDGKQCYIYTKGLRGCSNTSQTYEEMEDITWRTNRLPIFQNHFNYDNKVFWCIYGNHKDETTDPNADNVNLYERYYKRHYDDIFSRNAKKITMDYKLTKRPKEAMKEFYIIDGKLFVLNKITDYDVADEEGRFTECEFISVQDIENYIK